MPISIGIITAIQSLENIRSVDREMRRRCSVTYLPYSTMSELGRLYTKNIRKFDGILFSGPIPRDYILENVSSITKPCRVIDLDDRDYYLAIARIFASRPGIDFSRVYFDVVMEPVILRNVFGNGDWPHTAAAHEPLKHRAYLRSAIYEKAMNTYRTLYREGQYDFFVTRYTNLAGRLTAERIPYLLLKPSPETVFTCFEQLLAEIKESHLQNSLIACCLIELPEEARSPENCRLLESALNAFNENRGNSMLIRKNGHCFEITTSSLEARDLTAEYSRCLLSDELKKTLTFSPLIGWGISFDVVDAYRNAKTALLSCQKDRSHFTYLVTEAQEMIGPLNSNRSVSYDLRPEAHIFSLAKAMGIAPVNLEKLISLQETRHMFEFTSSDLVYFLEITPRSAARILAKLSESGFGRPIRTVNLSGTGRPTTVYELDFHTLIS